MVSDEEPKPEPPETKDEPQVNGVGEDDVPPQVNNKWVIEWVCGWLKGGVTC